MRREEEWEEDGEDLCVGDGSEEKRDGSESKSKEDGS